MFIEEFLVEEAVVAILSGRNTVPGVRHGWTGDEECRTVYQDCLAIVIEFTYTQDQGNLIKVPSVIRGFEIAIFARVDIEMRFPFSNISSTERELYVRPFPVKIT
jgi:hypothetical protein